MDETRIATNFMTQLLLNIAPDWLPTLNNFVVGRNVELLSTLRQISIGTGDRCLYLWGESASGRTHLMQAAVMHARSLGQVAKYARGTVPDAASMVAVDDVEALDGAGQVALFALYNCMRENGGALLVSGASAPTHLAVRDDLRTRLGWGLIYQVHALSDEEKMQALEQHAQARGLVLPREVTQYLLRHGQRDMPALLGLLDAMDAQCMRLQRAPSVPLLKDVMQTFNLGSV